jgi:hypothetical protein
MKFSQEQKIELERLCNIWFEKAEELAEEHFDESKLYGWDDDESFGRYETLIECRTKLMELLK